MRVRATAVASDSSDAIGTVEVEPTAHGLVIVLLGVAAFREGYAPGALAHGTQVVVPWAQVSAATLQGEHLLLVVEDARLPHRRFVLGGFSSGDVLHPAEAFRQRVALRAGAATAGLIVLSATWLALPQWAPRITAAATLAVGTLGAAVVVLAGLVVEQRVGRGADAATVAAALLRELRAFTTVGRGGVARPPGPGWTDRLLARLDGWFPRTVAAGAVALAAALVATLFSARTALGPGARPTERAATYSVPAQVADGAPAGVDARPGGEPEPPRAADALAAGAASSPAPEGAMRVQSADACVCRRPDSPLWAAPLPRVSVLVLERRLGHRGGHPRLTVDIAAVNNGRDPVKEVSLLLQFREGSADTVHRALFFPGELLPGEAIKWTAEARGDSFSVVGADDAELGLTGDDAATADQMLRLLSANHRPVRLHGAMLLAWRGDPRAGEAVEKLVDDLRDAEAGFAARLRRATGPVRVCGLSDDQQSPRHVEVCVYNASSEPQGALGVRFAALAGPMLRDEPLAAPPTELGDVILPVVGTLQPGSGVLLRGTLELPPEAARAPLIEAHAGRIDLLR